MPSIAEFMDFVLHVNVHLGQVLAVHGAGWLYGLLFLVVFCETGLVVTPFLPGDSLLFAAGALAAASQGAVQLPMIFLVVWLAPLCGDQVNYWVGRLLGAKIPFRPTNRFLKSAYLDQTRAFYARWGGSTVIAARFVPIVRTFAPFVAGLGRMSYLRYVAFSLIGTTLWAGLCVGAGAFLGNIPWVQKNFSVVALAIVAISVAPMAIAALRSRSGSAISA
jgi:membrane-associated protein